MGHTVSDELHRLERHESSRLRAAAAHALRVHPGPVGEVLARELLAYAEFGYRTRDSRDDALIPRLARQVLATPVPRAAAQDAA